MEAKTSERPILFSDEMVRAILDGRKTQTRRPVTRQPGPSETIDRNDRMGWHIWWDFSFGPGPHHIDRDYAKIKCPFGSPGDRLWVREAFTYWERRESDAVLKKGESRAWNDPGSQKLAERLRRDGEDYLKYMADGYLRPLSEWAEDYVVYDHCIGRFGRITPSIAMPRWASRLTLEVKAVRVERLQSISDDDAEAEGVPRNWVPGCKGWSAEEHGFLDREGLKATKEGREILEYGFFTAREAFQSLWDSIYSPKGLGWDANPYVWVVEFERVTP